MNTPLFGAIEAGGTKFICAVGNGEGKIIDKIRISTTTPPETLEACNAYFLSHHKSHPLAAIGIACFGPLDLNPKSSTFGSITKTPKKGWADTPIRTLVARALNIPVAIDTDVNGAVLAEHRWGAARGIESALYLTIGTGIGGGALIRGEVVHGLVHPEMGHIRVKKHPEDHFAGVCPYHGDCFEGLAAGPALGARWKQEATEFASDHPAWEIESHYIAEALCTYICTLSPEIIILGGGVMDNRFLFSMIREKVARSLNGYIASPAIEQINDSYIVPQGLHGDAGVLGAIALAMKEVGIENQLPNRV